MPKSDATYQFQTSWQDESDPSGNGGSAGSLTPPNLDSQDSNSIGANTLSVALIGPDEQRRSAVSAALAEASGNDVREFTSYPPALDDVPRLLEHYHDVIILDLDSNPEYALELVENICAKYSTTVIVYSAITDRDLVVRCMRAGAREYLTLPLDQNTMAEALVRAAANLHPESRLAGSSELRNSNPQISQFFKEGSPIFFNESSPILEIANNQFETRSLGVNEEQDAKALTGPAQWKILDDHAAARPTTTTLPAQAGSPISRLTRQMARPVSNLPDRLEKEAGFSFGNLSESIAEKITVIEEAPAMTTAAPTITWPAPAPITIGTALSSNQLNAEATVAGSFVYTPSPGYVLPLGTHTLWTTFTPADPSTGPPVQAAVSIDVTKAIPAINWSNPAVIPSGKALSATQLNATASVPGSFGYAPALGDVLPQGKHALSVTFTPADEARYTTAQATVTVTVAKAPPVINWTPPAPIPYGTVLSRAQLNAEASAAGSFEYTPGEGAKLAVGTHTLFATFIPSDPVACDRVQSAITLTVVKATPAIEWSTPEAITEGTPLSAAQLNATASVPGTFVYSPAPGNQFAPGTHTLSVTFTPAGAANYTEAHAEVSISVASIAPVPIIWPIPSDISYGAPLGSTQLNATAPVHGSYFYCPSAGDILPVGRHTLSVIFTPADTTQYATAQATVALVVDGLPHIASQHSPAAAAESVDRSALLDARQDSSHEESAPDGNVVRETRKYKGATYEKGDDGQWHLRRT
jgi:DNA-binding NarL/FixJ family response regulator